MIDTDKVFNDDRNEMFMNNLNSTLSVKRDYEVHEYDYEWLDMIEDCLPYLDNILRNPKRFIINEEDIVKVELARRVTVESVIHLTQHTNLIQDFDEESGDVHPAKILNINKEESLDTYENRFIYTLINNMRLFYEQRVAVTSGNSSYKDLKRIKYEGNSVVGSEVVDIKVEISSVDKNTKGSGGKSVLSYEDRLKKIKVQLDGFMSSELIQTLSKLHVSPVRSPIRKTNVILKNPNFKKAEELWNYIQSYVSCDKNEEKKDDYFDEGSIKSQYDQSVLMAYIAACSLSDEKEELTEKEMLTQVIDRFIDNLLDTDPNISEDDLKMVFHQEIKKVKEDNYRKRKTILNVFKTKLENELKSIDRSFELLDKEG